METGLTAPWGENKKVAASCDRRTAAGDSSLHAATKHEAKEQAAVSKAAGRGIWKLNT